jgi:predicted PurR-regulated permease PerM
MLQIAIVQAFVTTLLTAFPQIPAGVSVFINSLIAQLPQLVAAGTDIADFVKTQVSSIGAMLSENRDPTQAEWDALNADLSVELAKLDASAGGATPSA